MEYEDKDERVSEVLSQMQCSGDAQLRLGRSEHLRSIDEIDDEDLEEAEETAFEEKTIMEQNLEDLPGDTSELTEAIERHSDACYALGHLMGSKEGGNVDREDREEVRQAEKEIEELEEDVKAIMGSIKAG